jgi:redox-sensitive bicupin YhaK (pirin superfamily)
VAAPEYRDLAPHYQQVSRHELPKRQNGDATVFSLIGDESPIEQHMYGRLTAAQIPAGGKTFIEAPRQGEDLFLYVTDGQGQVIYADQPQSLGIYDVILARPNLGAASVQASPDEALHLLSFYLPSFLPESA